MQYNHIVWCLSVKTICIHFITSCSYLLEVSHFFMRSYVRKSHPYLFFSSISDCPIIFPTVLYPNRSIILLLICRKNNSTLPPAAQVHPHSLHAPHPQSIETLPASGTYSATQMLSYLQYPFHRTAQKPDILFNSPVKSNVIMLLDSSINSFFLNPICLNILSGMNRNIAF